MDSVQATCQYVLALTVVGHLTPEIVLAAKFWHSATWETSMGLKTSNVCL